MASITLHDTTGVLFAHALESLRDILKKAEAHARATGTNPDAYAAARLAPDMHPLSFQVQTVSNTVKKCLERLLGRALISFPDSETSFAQLQQRVAKTLEIVKAIKPEEINGKEGTKFELSLGSAGALDVTGAGSVFGHSIPNLFFHLNATYAILRSKGVPLGKSDYLAAFLMPYKLD